MDTDIKVEYSEINCILRSEQPTPQVNYEIGYGELDMKSKKNIGKKNYPIVPQTNTKTSKGSTKPYIPCWQTHKPLPIEIEGKKYFLYGVSATQSAPPKDVEVFIGFDHGMVTTERSYPWNPHCEFLYPITDMSVPKDVPSFINLLDYLKEQLVLGKKIHIGCIGGHGRTGLVMAALVKRVMGVDDAIKYVRDNYCEKAVESQVQVDFLHKHFGIKKVAISKPNYGIGFTNSYAGYGNAAFHSSKETISHLYTEYSIHGVNVTE